MLGVMAGCRGWLLLRAVDQIIDNGCCLLCGGNAGCGASGRLCSSGRCEAFSDEEEEAGAGGQGCGGESHICCELMLTCLRSEEGYCTNVPPASTYF